MQVKVTHVKNRAKLLIVFYRLSKFKRTRFRKVNGLLKLSRNAVATKVWLMCNFVKIRQSSISATCTTNVTLVFEWAIPDLFFFIISCLIKTASNVNVHYKIFPMTGFELQTSGIGRDHSDTERQPLCPTRYSGQVQLRYCIDFYC